MNLSSEGARSWIIGLWLLTVVFAVIRENQKPDSVNPGKPLPRPCVLLGSAAAYTVFGLGAELAPNLAVLVAAGVTLGALIKAPQVTVGGQPQSAPLVALNQALQKLNSLTGA